MILCLILAVLGGHNAFAQTSASCVDSDGDGWGWDGSQTCQVAPQTATPSNSCVDSDGDGWGWDGSASCQVSATGSNSSSESAVGSESNSGSASCIDDDGDGWGWNGSASCQTGSTGSAGQESTADTGQEPSGGDAESPQQGGGQVNVSGPYNQSRDLIALHFDFAPDPDDAHAAAAGRVVQDQLGFAVQVVAGTYGVWSADRYDSGSVSVMNAMWGGNWLNAHSSRNSSVDQAVNRWVGTLAGGGDVWVAEGGPSDFTAAVVEKINQQFPEFNTRNRIHVVQHSVWNEDHSLASRLDYVRSNTQYIKIEDGNEPNSTADFRESSQFFVSQATSGRYASVWNAAFAYLSPNEKLDFSDAVELLHILGINRNQIATVDDFARRFLN